MTEITRLKGKTSFGTYVVSVHVTEQKIDKIEINGKPHKSVTELCETLARAHTSLCSDSIKAIKFTMAKHNEYQGVSAQ